jgi:alpha-tubulin suppressor-like RCC1 family protein
VSGAGKTVAAIKTDGTLWTWGTNPTGQLGTFNGSNPTSSPVQVGTLTNWKLVSGQQNSFAAIKTDGTLWTWGANTSGQLGLFDIIHRSSPVQVGTLTNWKLVTPAYDNVASIKTDGTLWVWGSNSGGKFGLGDFVNRSSPVQVGTLTNWKQVACGINQLFAISSPDLP